ncbi:YdjY domain-containing protein [Rubritalea spongiae]|uniref:YdjY domain-containing protein n=1 Tax=Rubritalea spongiae TaxID=430797 RepID=A0ABW5E5Y4_9BACT
MRTVFFFTLLNLGLFADVQKVPEVVQIDETRYRLGAIEIDSAKRTITFPAEVEQTEVLVEYLLVTAQGKVHESVFITEVDALELNIAMKLLGYKESKELIQILDENHEATGVYFKAKDEQTKRLSRLSISVYWELDGKQYHYHPHQLINVESTASHMPNAPWIYSGSMLNKGKLQASLTGDIIAVYTDRTALINYSGEGREDDTIWLPNKKLLPPLSTPVTITLTQTNKPN